jgi:energy-coupling factor transporter ATP-binding protein EcfA2
MSNFYLAHGIQIESVIPLPQLIPTKPASADVSIHFAERDAFPDTHGKKHGFVTVAADYAYFHSEIIGDFAVVDGKHIHICPVPTVETTVLNTLIVTTLLNMLLFQRNNLLLHGSSVLINGKAVAFLGKSGWGKSTLAATLSLLGYPIITDDMIKVDFSPNYEVLVEASFPYIKLWPNSVTALDKDLANTDRIYSLEEKRLLPTERTVTQTQIPLKYIYVLTTGPENRIEAQSIQQSFSLVFAHTYPSAFFTSTQIDLLSITGKQQSHLRNLAKLIENVSVYRLTRPWNLNEIKRLARFIEDDVLSNEGNAFSNSP